MDKLVYTLGNPSTSRISEAVPRLAGAHHRPHGRKGDSQVITRPKMFFRDQGPVAQTCELDITIPPIFVTRQRLLPSGARWKST